MYKTNACKNTRSVYVTWEKWYIRPFIKVKGAHSRQMCAEITVDSWAFNTDERTQIEACPVGICNHGNQTQVSYGECHILMHKKL